MKDPVILTPELIEQIKNRLVGGDLIVKGINLGTLTKSNFQDKLLEALRSNPGIALVSFYRTSIDLIDRVLPVLDDLDNMVTVGLYDLTSQATDHLLTAITLVPTTTSLEVNLGKDALKAFNRKFPTMKFVTRLELTDVRAYDVEHITRTLHEHGALSHVLLSSMSEHAALRFFESINFRIPEKERFTLFDLPSVKKVTLDYLAVQTLAAICDILEKNESVPFDVEIGAHCDPLPKDLASKLARFTKVQMAPASASIPQSVAPSSSSSSLSSSSSGSSNSSLNSSLPSSLHASVVLPVPPNTAASSPQRNLGKEKAVEKVVEVSSHAAVTAPIPPKRSTADILKRMNEQARAYSYHLLSSTAELSEQFALTTTATIELHEQLARAKSECHSLQRELEQARRNAAQQKRDQDQVAIATAEEFARKDAELSELHAKLASKSQEVARLRAQALAQAKQTALMPASSTGTVAAPANSSIPALPPRTERSAPVFEDRLVNIRKSGEDVPPPKLIAGMKRPISSPGLFALEMISPEDARARLSEVLSKTAKPTPANR